MKNFLITLLILLVLAEGIFILDIRYSVLENAGIKITSITEKKVEYDEAEIQPQIEETPKPAAIPTAPPKQSYIPVVFDFASYTGKYILKVNVECNVVTIYIQDEDGDYVVPVKAMLCSTGEDTMREGIYVPGEQHRWANLFGDVYGQYSVEIKGDILFHSVPYTKWGNPSTLEYWEYDQLGTSCSLGCVRLCAGDAKWIYDNTSNITAIIMYEDPIPGPLGKPELEPISENELNRGWDPTDPDPENLWTGGSGFSVYTMREHLIEEAKYNG